MREISIDAYQLSIRTDKENKLLNNLFEKEFSSEFTLTDNIYLPYRTKPLIFEDGYYSGFFINNKNYNLPIASKPRTKTIRDLPIDKDESLGYGTAFIYDTYSNIIMIERLQNGLTIDRLSDYFMHYHKSPRIKGSNILDYKIFENFKKLGSVKSFKLQIARINRGYILKSKNKTVNQIVDISEDINADEIIVEFRSKGYKNNIVFPKFKEIVKFLKHEKEDDLIVEKIIINGKDEDEEIIKPFDYATEIMKRKIQVEHQRSNNEAAITLRQFELKKLFLEERKGMLKTYDLRDKEI